MKRYYMILGLVSVLLFVASTVFAAAPGWASSTVTYHLNGHCCDAGAVPTGYKPNVRNAAITWTNATRIDYVENSSSANWIGWDDVTKWGAPSSAGAVTAQGWNSSGQMVRANMIFNKNMSWATDGSPTALDVENTAAHEFGHFGGLNDLTSSGDGLATMYMYTSYGETIKRTLEYQDTWAMNGLYP